MIIFSEQDAINTWKIPSNVQVIVAGVTDFDTGFCFCCLENRHAVFWELDAAVWSSEPSRMSFDHFFDDNWDSPRYFVGDSFEECVVKWARNDEVDKDNVTQVLRAANSGYGQALDNGVPIEDILGCYGGR